MSEHPTNTQKKIAVPANLESALIIYVKEARKIMGEDARTLSDEELTIEIWQLMEIASDLLKSALISRGKQL